jgi:hypothetical protein
MQTPSLSKFDLLAESDLIFRGYIGPLACHTYNVANPRVMSSSDINLTTTSAEGVTGKIHEIIQAILCDTEFCPLEMSRRQGSDTHVMSPSAMPSGRIAYHHGF